MAKPSNRRRGSNQYQTKDGVGPKMAPVFAPGEREARMRSRNAACAYGVAQYTADWPDGWSDGWSGGPSAGSWGPVVDVNDEMLVPG